jgi:hypothetical protein
MHGLGVLVNDCILQEVKHLTLLKSPLSSTGYRACPCSQLDKFGTAKVGTQFYSETLAWTLSELSWQGYTVVRLG